MTRIRPLAVWLISCCVPLSGPELVRADGLLTSGALDRLAAQRYWELQVSQERGERITRVALIDDNLYLFTNENRVIAIHALTGIVRWSRVIAEPDQTVRGPSHNQDYVFFTTGGSVTVLNRRTGEAAGRPRSLQGVIIEVRHDTATISLGAAHGVKPDDVFNVTRLNEIGEPAGDPVARLVVESVNDRSARGRLTRLDSIEKARPGDQVTADVVLPLERVKLPFAASCAAEADEKRIYVGAANQRFYSLDILGGFQHWQLMTPKTVSATPVLDGQNLYFAGQDGRVVSCTKEDRVANWTFQTEGPVFADLLVEGPRVFVASSDRSLYCLDRVTGKRLWRQRFETPLTQKPAFADGRVYQLIPGQGLYVLDARTGEPLWQHDEDAELLAQFEKDVFLLSTSGAPRVLRVDAATGSVKSAVDCAPARFGAAMQAHQVIVLVSEDGQLICMRSRNAPRLRPAELADVLRSDEKMKLAASVEARRNEAAATPPVVVPELPPLDWLFDDDWLASRNTAAPVGGRGLVDMGEPVRPADREEAAPRRTTRKTDEEEADDEEESDDEESDEDDEDEDEEDTDESETTDEESSEDEADEDADGEADDSEDEAPEEEDSDEEDDPFGGEEPDDEDEDENE